MPTYYIKGCGIRTHVCNCPKCTFKGTEEITIREYVTADTLTKAEFVILEREGKVLGDFWWLKGPEIYLETPHTD